MDAFVKEDASLRIETPQYKVTIYALDGDRASAKEKAIRVAQSLHGANALAKSITKNSPLDTAVSTDRICP
ncbi:MAG: hypothetical protein WEC75_03845 [Dehalococcoidia bacterium]